MSTNTPANGADVVIAVVAGTLSGLLCSGVATEADVIEAMKRLGKVAESGVLTGVAGPLVAQGFAAGQKAMPVLVAQRDGGRRSGS